MGGAGQVGQAWRAREATFWRSFLDAPLEA